MKVSGPPIIAIKVIVVIQIDFAGIQTTLPFSGSLLSSIIRPVEMLLMANSLLRAHSALEHRPPVH